MVRAFLIIVWALTSMACARLEDVGKVPEFTPIEASMEAQAMQRSLPLASDVGTFRQVGPSLWSRDRASLLGDRRAERRGDILTVVIEIDESAEISNSSQRARSGSESSSVSSLIGLPQLTGGLLPRGASFDDLANTNSNSSSSGNGSVRRNESLELRVAATIVDVLDNGVVRIQGSQEVRVNFEIRELLVTGYVRPEDISRRNEITYDKIAAARISYGGRGQISDVQQPRIGQQIADIVLPF